MTLDVLRNFIQSSHINFLYGSGVSRPYLATLGNIDDSIGESVPL